jgi:hypothetical protein
VVLDVLSGLSTLQSLRNLHQLRNELPMSGAVFVGAYSLEQAVSAAIVKKTINPRFISSFP